MNLGMSALQDALHDHGGALSAAQREAVLEHPRRSVALQRAAGVDDADWLCMVSHQHEHADGTGFRM
jgi:HD-GYP domain-containing protein (c-di-GMP phosphodiesterase class II)